MSDNTKCCGKTTCPREDSKCVCPNCQCAKDNCPPNCDKNCCASAGCGSAKCGNANCKCGADCKCTGGPACATECVKGSCK
uniref:Metallothionein-2 n=1 Tax=Polypheretima elongata TaxID=508769 RepID=C0IN15_9ANNE|nr:metallothionein-2 [Polypheretima elongata]